MGKLKLKMERIAANWLESLSAESTSSGLKGRKTVQMTIRGWIEDELWKEYWEPFDRQLNDLGFNGDDRYNLLGYNRAKNSESRSDDRIKLETFFRCVATFHVDLAKTEFPNARLAYETAKVTTINRIRAMHLSSDSRPAGKPLTTTTFAMIDKFITCEYIYEPLLNMISDETDLQAVGKRYHKYNIAYLFDENVEIMKKHEIDNKTQLYEHWTAWLIPTIVFYVNIPSKREFI